MEIEEYINKGNHWQINKRTPWQEISLWLRYWGFQNKQYDNLPSHLKEVLQNCICEPVKTTSDTQRNNLMKALLNVTAGRKTNDPIELVIPEEQKKLRPLTENEKNDFLSKH